MVNLVVAHDHDAHDEDNKQLYEEWEEKEIKFLIVFLADAGAEPGTMMIEFLNANSTDITMTSPRRTIDITGHAKFDPINFPTFRNEIGNLYMTLDMLIFGYDQKITLHFVFLVLS
jgi:hypothetical protein